tara:strand:- start:445 stop:684 length:240 start_codon:yes stop_codon:yes gene_type:complete
MFVLAPFLVLLLVFVVWWMWKDTRNEDEHNIVEACTPKGVMRRLHTGFRAGFRRVVVGFLRVGRARPLVAGFRVVPVRL